MDELTTIARPYAQAVLAEARADGTLAEWSDALALLAGMVRDRELAGIIANPRVAADRLTALVLDIAGERLGDKAANLVRLLVHNRRLSVLPQIAEQFEAGRAETEGRRHVEVVSAYKLTVKQKNALAQAISERLGRDVDVTVSIDKALIGGVVIRAGDTVIDASMRGRLGQLAHALGAAA